MHDLILFVMAISCMVLGWLSGRFYQVRQSDRLLRLYLAWVRGYSRFCGEALVLMQSFDPDHRKCQLWARRYLDWLNAREEN